MDVRADERDEMARADSVKFRSIISKVESLHEHGMYSPFARSRKRDFGFLGFGW